MGGFPRRNRIDYTYSYFCTSTIPPGGDTERNVTLWWCLLMESRYDQGLRVRKEVLGAEHVALYAGIPAANAAFAEAKEILGESER